VILEARVQAIAIVMTPMRSVIRPPVHVSASRTFSKMKAFAFLVSINRT